MFFNKVELYKNNALDVSGIESIIIEIHKKILVIIGDNGSGKSTIVNEINPLPSTQSDYNKGFSRLFITHNNKNYVLESNFKKGLHHSFKEEGEELNTSFKNTIQKDLCEAVFHYTQFINNVITMQYKITKMGPNDRRNLFFNAYPYMNEILNKHKKISSIIKSYQSNLKMLNGRKSELLVEQMKPTDIKELKDRYDELKKGINEIEKILYTLELENKKLIEELEKIKSNKELKSEDVIHLCNSLRHKILFINRNINYGLLDHKDPDILVNSLFTNKSVLEFKLENIEKNISSINKDIEEFESFLKANSEIDKESLEKSVDNLTKIISEIVVDLSLPLMGRNVIDIFERDILKQLEEHIKFIHSINSKIFNLKISSNIQNKISQLNMELANNQSLYENYLEQLKELKNNVFILPPEDCFNPSCKLKNNSLKTFESNEERINKIENILNKLLKEKDRKIKILDKLNKLISATLSTENSVGYVSHILMSYGLCEYIYGDSNLIDFINKNPVEIINKIKRLIKISYEFILKQEYEKTLSNDKIKLDIINRAPSKQIISNTLLTKQVELNNLLEEYRKSSIELKDIVKEYELSKDLKDIVSKLKNLQAYWEVYSRYLILNKSLQWNRDLQKKLIEKKNILTDSLVSIETTLRKQENISVRLNQEINPNIDNINKELYKYVLIEEALSPYNGIPKKYMIMFINNVIQDINFYISSILNTDIEIELIDENSQTVNYLFPVKINGRTIPDINKCSKAQSNIIDICLNLALYKQLKLNDNYPLIMDEPDDGFSEGNRTRLLMLLSSMVEQDQIYQLILISHFASMLGGFNNSDIVCLSEENIVLPPVYNQNVIIK